MLQLRDKNEIETGWYCPNNHLVWKFERQPFPGDLISSFALDPANINQEVHIIGNPYICPICNIPLYAESKYVKIINPKNIKEWDE